MPYFTILRTLFFRATSTWSIFAFLCIFLSGCTDIIASRLDETDANRMTIALRREAIEATKEPDPENEGKFRLRTPTSRSLAALELLAREHLPRERPQGVRDLAENSGLIPSPSAERAQFMAALAGDLERSLLSIDGVLNARVHLNVPTASAWSDESAPPSASVLLSYRGATAPIEPTSIARLVAGGVAHLAPSDVAVILSPAPTVDPVDTRRNTPRPIVLLIAALATLATTLALTSVVFYRRLARQGRAPTR